MRPLAPRLALPALLAALGALAGCLGPVALTRARPVPVGEVELTTAVSAPLRVEGDGGVLFALQPELAVRFGAAEPVDIGLRIGLPTGIGADVKVALARAPGWALSLLPGGGFTPFQLEGYAMFGWLDAPLLFDLDLGEHTLTLGGRYRLVMYLESGPSATPFAHAAGAELAAHLRVERSFFISPHVSWLRTVAGRFLHGRDTVTIGLSAQTRF